MNRRLYYLALPLSLLISACGGGGGGGLDSSPSTNSTTTNSGSSSVTLGYPIVDTNQSTFYNSLGATIAKPLFGDTYYGQDAQFTGNSPNYTANGDGTVTDNVTGLMWQASPDTDGNGDINADDKLTYAQALNRASTLTLGGYTDWRLPTIKELYSLILFSGGDPSSYAGTDTAPLTPFIDTAFFDFAYGDTDASERIIDAQFASSTLYVSNTANDGGSTLFGVNFADGRIKGYGLSLFGADKTFYVIYVRGNTSYGLNLFTDNGDGTISDEATGLMWEQADSGVGLTWEQAFDWVQQQNAVNHLGYSDWRLPNIKELHSILDYSRSPDTTNTPTINPLFVCSETINEAGDFDYHYYWSGTTHASHNGLGANAAYLSFGRAMGYMGSWVDVHGAGAQRSDPKDGNPWDYPTGKGPQGDAIRIHNYVRLVR